MNVHRMFTASFSEGLTSTPPPSSCSQIHRSKFETLTLNNCPNLCPGGRYQHSHLRVTGCDLGPPDRGRPLCLTPQCTFGALLRSGDLTVLSGPGFFEFSRSERRMRFYGRSSKWKEAVSIELTGAPPPPRKAESQVELKLRL